VSIQFGQNSSFKRRLERRRADKGKLGRTNPGHGSRERYKATSKKKAKKNMRGFPYVPKRRRSYKTLRKVVSTRLSKRGKKVLGDTKRCGTYVFLDILTKRSRRRKNRRTIRN